MQTNQEENNAASERDKERADRAAKIQRDNHKSSEVTFTKEEKVFKKKVRGLRREITKALEFLKNGFSPEVPERFASGVQSLCQDLKAAKVQLDVMVGKDDEE